MAGEWHVVPLGQLVDVYDGPHATPPKTDAGPIFLGISNLAQGRLDLSNAEHLNEQDFERWTRRVTPEMGDVVFSYETRLGEAALIPSGLRCCLGRRMGLLRTRPGRVDSRFLLYAYLGPEFQGTLRERTIHGSTVDRIPLIDMPKFPIRIPKSIEEQRAIAHILGTLDDKIELNRRTKETLEAMARAIFKSWFVDFDPVRAKVEGRDPGLPEHIANLFPDRFEDSELGEIPAGWKVRSLSDVCENIFSGGTPRTTSPAYWEGGIPWLSSGETRSKFIIGTEKTITREGVTNSGTRLARPGATVIAGAGQGQTRGQTAMLMLHSYINQSVVALVADALYSSDTHLFFDLERRYEQFRQVSDAHSSRGSLTTKLLGSIQTTVPPRYVIEAFDNITAPIVSRIASTLEQSRILAAIRDALLPRLISGELRVEEAQHTVEEHV